MADNRELAGKVLDTAKQTITKDRGDQHGSAENSFEMIAEFWTTYLRHTNKQRYGNELTLVIGPADVAQMMSLLKKCRFVYGNPANPDNFIDDVGYSGLAGMMALDGTDFDPNAPGTIVDGYEVKDGVIKEVRK